MIRASVARGLASCRRSVEPWYLVAGVTTNISTNVTNDFHYSFLRNWWAWTRAGDVIQGCTLCAGLGGALADLLSDDARRDALARAGRERALTYDWSRVVPDIEDVYDKALHGQRR